MTFLTRKALTRRTMLKGMGASVALPLLGTAAVAEEALEDDARVELWHVGRRLAAPRDGIDVEAVA